MFNFRSKPKEAIVATVEPRERSWHEQNVLLRAAKEVAIDAALPDLVARHQEFVDAAIAEHAADVVGYQFDCCRHGDFLTVFTSRIGHDGKPVKFSTAINLLKVDEIRLEAGAPPAADREVTWGFRYTRADGGWYGSSPMHSPREGETLEATAWVNPAQPGRVAYREPDTAERRSGIVISHGPDTVRKGTIPAPAADDVIRFVGIGSSLLVPYGLGQGVYDRIMQEMANTPTVAPLL